MEKECKICLERMDHKLVVKYLDKVKRDKLIIENKKKILNQNKENILLTKKNSLIDCKVLVQKLSPNQKIEGKS